MARSEERTIPDGRTSDGKVGSVDAKASLVEVCRFSSMRLLVSNKVGEQAKTVCGRRAALSLVEGDDGIVEDGADVLGAI